VFDGWEMDEKLRHVERVLSGGKDQKVLPVPQRAEAAHAGPPAWHVRPTRRSSRRRAETIAVRRRPTALLTGTIALAGATVFGVGVGLLAWSYALGRPALAPLGAPVALGGQIILLVSLILQISRSAAANLDKVEGQLRELKTTTTLLGTTKVQPPPPSTPTWPRAPAHRSF